MILLAKLILSVGRAGCMEESTTPHLAALEPVPEQTIDVNDSQRLCILSWSCCLGPDWSSQFPALWVVFPFSSLSLPQNTQSSVHIVKLEPLLYFQYCPNVNVPAGGVCIPRKSGWAKLSAAFSVLPVVLADLYGLVHIFFALCTHVLIT